MPLAAPSAAVVGLLGQVRRGVVTGDRVLRQQESERQHVEPEPQLLVVTSYRPPVLLTRVGEDVVDVPVRCSASRKNQRMATMTTRPMTCHHTETLLTMASR